MNRQQQPLGLNLDSTFQSDKDVTFALNMMVDSHDGGLPEYQSEPGNILTDTLPAGSKIVGSINGKGNDVLVFLTNGLDDRIGLVKGNQFQELVQARFGFSLEYPITGEYRIKNGCDDVFYWCDHRNPDRWINISRLDDFKTAGLFDVNKFAFTPKVQVPNIDLISVNDSGGQLQVGSYYFQIEILDSNQNLIFKSDITPQVPIILDDSSKSYHEIDGDVNYPLFSQNVGGVNPTNKSITLRFSNLSTAQAFIRVKVGYQNSANQTISAHEVATLIPIVGSSVDWTYSGISVSSGDSVIDFSSMEIPLSSYESSYVMEQVQNRLVRANLKGRARDFTSLQNFVQSINLTWIAQESPTEIVDVGNPKDPRTYWYKCNFQGDEVYALGIQLLFDDGQWSPVFHKAGRPSISSDTQLLTVVSNGAVLGSNDVWLSDVEHLGYSLGQTVPRWKVFNTATITGTSIPHPYGYEGTFGYHESEQTYPTTRDCDGNYIYGSLAGTKIRHHRFPDRKLVPHINSGDYIVQLGIKAVSPTLPDGIVGYRICMAERTDNDKTVTDSGYLTKALHYNYADPIPDNLGLTAMEMDYFDDAISPIPPPKKYGRYTSSNVLFNRKITPANYVKFNQIYKFSSGNIAPGTYPYFFVDLFDPAPYDAKLYSIIMTMRYVLHTAPRTTNYKIGTSAIIGEGEKVTNVIGINVGSNDWFSPNAVTVFNSDIENSETLVPGQSFGTSPVQPSAYLRANNFYVYRKRILDPYNNLFALTYKYVNLNPFTGLTNYTYGGDTLIVPQGALRSLVLPTDATSVSVDRFAHATWWKDRWEEQQFNTAFRYNGLTVENTFYHPSNGDMHNVLKVASENENPFDGYILKEDFERIPESYKLNLDYSKQSKQFAKIPLPRDFNYCSKCLDFYPNRIIFSPVSFSSELADQYRVNLSSDYIDIPAHRGEITGIKYRNNMLFVHCEDGTFILQPNPQTLQTNTNEVYITTGDFLSIPPQEFSQTDLGFAGCQSKQSQITIENYHCWVDQKRGKVFGYSDGLNVLSDLGMNQYFMEKLPSEQLSQIELAGYSRPFNSTLADYGFGVHMYYDPRFKRLFLTKRDRLAINQTFNPDDGMFFNGQYWEYYENGILLNSYIESTDVDRFEDRSWTISFDLRYFKKWISWHSYIPYFAFSDNQSFYSCNGYDIYKHLFVGNFQTFYNQKYDAIIETMVFDINMFDVTNIVYNGYTYQWDATNKQWLERDETFNKFICYTNTQSTGLQDLILHNQISNPYANIYTGANKYVKRTKNTYRISEIFDMSIGQPVMTEQWTFKKNYGSYIDAVVNTPQVNLNKSQYNWSRIKDQFVKTRLFFKPVTDSKIIFILNEILGNYKTYQ